MTAATITLNPGTGGGQPLVDTLATVDGGAAPAGSSVQMVKVGHGAASDFKTASAASPLPVYGPDAMSSGNLTATDAVGGVPSGAGAFINAASTAGSIVAIACPGGDSAWNVQITGLTTGAIYFEGSLDSTNGTNGNWIAVNGRQTGVVNTVLGNNATTNGAYRGNTSGLAYLRVRQTGAYTATPAIVIRISDGVGAVFLNASTPAGTNLIGYIEGTGGALLARDGTDISAPTAMPAGGVGIRGWLSAIWTKLNGTLGVTGTFWQATQPVSLATNTPDVTDRAARLLGVVASITGALPAGAASIGTVQQAAITKGAQGATGVMTQDLKDAGRNQIHFYMLIPVLTSATDTLQSLTGTKSGATVAATATPAAVTAGKTLRITRIAASYIATAVSGYGIVRLRFNTAGVVAVNSPIAATLAVGAGTSGAANSVGIEEATLEEGWEFAAATGVGISVQGFAAATATAVGYVLVSVTGYEY